MQLLSLLSLVIGIIETCLIFGIIIYGRHLYKKQTNTELGVGLYRSPPLLICVVLVESWWWMWYTALPFVYEYLSVGTWKHSCSIARSQMLVSVTSTFCMHLFGVVDIWLLQKVHKEDNDEFSLFVNSSHSRILQTQETTRTSVEINIVKNAVTEVKIEEESTSFSRQVAFVSVGNKYPRNKLTIYEKMFRLMRKGWFIFFSEIILSSFMWCILWSLETRWTWSTVSFFDPQCHTQVTQVVLVAKSMAVAIISMIIWFLMKRRYGGAYKRQIMWCMVFTEIAVLLWMFLTFYIHPLSGSFSYALLCLSWGFFAWIYFPYEILYNSKKNSSNSCFSKSKNLSLACNTLQDVWKNPALLRVWINFTCEQYCSESTKAFRFIESYWRQERQKRLLDVEPSELYNLQQSFLHTFYWKFIDQNSSKAINVTGRCLQKWKTLYNTMSTAQFVNNRSIQILQQSVSEHIRETYNELESLLRVSIFPAFLNYLERHSFT